MLTRTLLVVAAVFLVLGVLLAACGGDGNEAIPPAEPAETAELPRETPAEPPSQGEASAPADATAESPETWDYVALGDSLTSFASWPEEYAAHIEEDIGVAVELKDRGLAGNVDAQILERIQSDSDLRGLIQEAEVITINGGVNALVAARNRYNTNLCEGDDNQECLRDMVNQFQANWAAILDEIVGLRSPQEALIRAVPMWIWVLDSYRTDPDEFQTLVSYALAMNEYAVRAAEERGIVAVDVNAAFHGANGENPAPSDAIGEDGLHLLDAGSTAIADLLRGAGYEYAE